MENSFSSSIIQVLKDNFVGKTVKNDNYLGVISDVVITVNNLENYSENILYFKVITDSNEVHYLNIDGISDLIIESTLPAEEKKDSTVRYINKTVFDEDILGYIDVGTEVNVIGARINEDCGSGVEVFIEIDGIKTSICASLLTCNKP